MPFYSKVSDHKARSQKRSEAETRGGFSDEGTRYSPPRKAEGGDARPKRTYGKPQAGGAPRPYTRKADDGAPRPYARKTEGDAPRPYTRKADDGAPRPYARKADDGAPRPYARKTEGGAPRPYAHKTEGGVPRPYARKTEGGVPRPYAPRPYTRKADDGAPRPYAHKTEGGAPRPYARKTEGGDSRPYPRKTEDGAPRPYARKTEGGAPRPYARKTEGGVPRPYARKTEGSAPRPYARKADDAETRMYDRKPADGDRDQRQPERIAQEAGEFRFAPPSASPYRPRGENAAPKPFAEQRRVYKQAYKAPDYYANRTDAAEMDSVHENLLSGRNPIREALKSGRDIEKLMVSRGELSGSAKEILAMAKEQHVPIQEVDRARLDAITPNHQGMLAFASAYQYHTVEDMLALAAERNEKPFLVMLDGVTDPHNLGAVIRTAECAGAHGVIVQERRAVGLTPAAVKASAGAIEHLMVARVVNLTATLDLLKLQGIWAYAADPKGEDYLSVDYSGGVVIVIGAEGEGVSRLVLEKCDKIVALPIRGKIGSLNASVAAGILLYAVLRSR
jgi:23S rRNA (guanosine2251-2'-O)-methyltransferase